jgi:hypothetical protein
MYAGMYAGTGGPELEAYASAAAALVGLPITDDWWPAVITNLRLLLEAADLVAGGPGSEQDVPALVFVP